MKLFKKKKDESIPDPSEGERFIAEYLKSERIRFKREVKINNLKDDSKAYRRADFYLPSYGVYIEFYGAWNNSKEDRERYRDKSNVFFNNRIPCVYLYPENLGIIDFSFNIRMKKVLRIHHEKGKLIRYLFKRIWRTEMDLIVILSVIGFYILVGDDDATKYIACVGELLLLIKLGVRIKRHIE